jgi:hypothetical protein
MWYSTLARFCDAARYWKGGRVSMTLRQVLPRDPDVPADRLFAVQLYGLFSLMLLSRANWKPSCMDSKTTSGARGGTGGRKTPLVG